VLLLNIKKNPAQVAQNITSTYIDVSRCLHAMPQTQFHAIKKWLLTPFMEGFQYVILRFLADHHVTKEAAFEQESKIYVAVSRGAAKVTVTSSY
jgi:hypothetical protein